MKRQPKVFSYLRVSTSETQTTDNQRMIIENSGFKVDEFIVEHGVSGSIEASKRPAFSKMLAKLQPQDTVIVNTIDRVGRSAIDVLSTVRMFERMGVKFRVVALDAIDLTSATGKLVVGMLAMVSELERNMISERTKQGLARTKAQGTVLGAKPKIDAETLSNLHQDFSKNEMLMRDIAAKYGISERAASEYKRKWRESYV